jgi:hypothetical protein
MQETMTEEEAAAHALAFKHSYHALGRVEGLKEAAEIVRKYPPLDWLANEIMEGIDA